MMFVMEHANTEQAAVAPDGALWQRAGHVAHHALAVGALRPVHTTVTHLRTGACNFVVHQLDAASASGALALKLQHSPFSDDRADREYNPFLPYDPALFVADLSATHVCLLNKFPVISRHLLIVTRTFVDQETVLDQADFAAWWACMGSAGALGFYNAGRIAGASQRHKHLQVVPLPLDPGGDAVPIAALLGPPQQHGELGMAAGLPFRHVLVWLDPAMLLTDAAPCRLLETYLAMLDACAAWQGDGKPAPYNLVLTHRWMLLAPRSQDRCQGIGVNGLGYAGSMLVRNTDEFALLRELGPLELLRCTGITEDES